MFLFNKKWPGFELVYDDSLEYSFIYIPKDKDRSSKIIGPLKIWKINYPPGIEINPEYLKT